MVLTITVVNNGQQPGTTGPGSGGTCSGAGGSGGIPMGGGGGADGGGIGQMANPGAGGGTGQGNSNNLGGPGGTGESSTGHPSVHGAGHAVLLPNELTQLMNGQTVTGLLNPDGSITINPNIMSAQDLTSSLPTSLPNGVSYSYGPISLTQLSALAQQGIIQLSPLQGIPTAGPNGRMMEMIPQAAIQGLLAPNGQPMQAVPFSNGTQIIAQDPSDPGKWQIIPSSQLSVQQSGIPTSTSNIGGSSDIAAASSRDGGLASGCNQTNTNNMNNNNSNISNNNNMNHSNPFSNQYSNSPIGVSTNDSPQAATTQSQRKLKRLACTCPNCRDGDNGRNGGGDNKRKQHICHFPDCNKVYGKTSHLRAHLRWHSGERPYVCGWSFCGKKFTRSDELQRHRRTHTGEKRFQCSECLKRFMRSDHLAKHLKTHVATKKCGNTQISQSDGLPNSPTPQTGPPGMSVKLE